MNVVPKDARSLWIGLCVVAAATVGSVFWTGGAALADAPQRPEQPGDSFQLEIEIVELLDDGQEKVQDRHLILFAEGTAYDFALLAPQDVTVVNPKREVVTLLSRQSHVKSTLSSQSLTAASARVRAYAADLGKEDRLGINAKPERVPVESSEESETSQHRYRVAFSGVEYEAVADVPPSDSQPRRIAEFTDWAAKLNLIRKLGTPPFARMRLGHLIAADGRIPSSITLKLTSNGKPRTFIARYTLREGLSDDDRSRLDKVAGMITLYNEVPVDAFPR